MSKIPDRCIEFDDRRKICIAFEKGKIYQLFNFSNHRIKKVKIDRCLLQSEGEKRCDYLMSVDNIKRVFFIELKGRNLVYALKQIHVTMNYFEREFATYQIDARIVGSGDVPRFITLPEYRKLAKAILATGGKIERATNNIYSENI